MVSDTICNRDGVRDGPVGGHPGEVEERGVVALLDEDSESIVLDEHLSARCSAHRLDVLSEFLEIIGVESDVLH